MLLMEAFLFFCFGSGQVTCFGHVNTLVGMEWGTVQTLRVPDGLAWLP